MRDTSIEAYQEIKNLNDKQKIVLETIKKNQPCTDYQISLMLGWPINRVTPRRGELESKGIIIDNGKVKGPTGRLAHQWKVKENNGFQLSLGL